MRYIVFSKQEMDLLKIHASDQDTRYPLSCIHFSKTQNRVITVDGRRMILIKKIIPDRLKGKTVEFPTLLKNQSCIVDSVQKKWLIYEEFRYHELFDNFYDVKDKKVNKKIIDEKILLIDSMIFCEKEYPKYKTYLPKYNKSDFEVRFSVDLMVKGFDYQMRMKDNLSPARGTMHPIGGSNEMDPAEIVLMPMKISDDDRKKVK